MTDRYVVAWLLVGLVHGASFVGLAAAYQDIFNEGYSAGFVEGEEHENQMVQVSDREQMLWREGETRRCVDACTARGFPSLNAFYVPDRARCMCQYSEADDDIHGFFWLVIEDD